MILQTLNDLKTRLKLNTRYTPPLEGVGFEYGFNSVYLEKVRKYWLEEYDWAKQQKMLNKYRQFKTKVNGLNIHFQRVSPSDKSVNNICSFLPAHIFLTQLPKILEIMKWYIS